ncbi:glycosyltransferase [Escherichia coli]|nr:glycosyltransferase [Escherichia coli]
MYGRDKLHFLNAADVFALPSHNENFGNVYLESLAAGTPILASKHTPWSIVEQFGCGQWVNNDEVSVTNALKLLFEGDAYHLHKNSLKCAQNYSWKKFSGNYF